MKLKTLFFIPFLALVLALTSFDKNNDVLRNDGKFVVVLDAGHGGHDPGNLGNGYLEKNIALNIVLKVGELLEKDPNIKVIYTRKDDTFVDLYVRGEIANKANADLFVSVHCDSHTSDANGAGTFVLGLHANKQNFEIAKKENSVIYLEDNYETRYADYDINSPESIIGLTIMQEEFLDQSINLAKMMQDNFSGKLNRTDRKVKQAGFIVLHQTFMPSVLVETGFLTNRSEGAYLNSSKGQSEMGKAIAEAILKYKNGVSSNVSQTVAAVSSPTEVVEEEKPQETTKKTTEVKAQQEAEKPRDTIVEIEKAALPEKSEETLPEGATEPLDVVVNEVSKDAPKITFKVQLLASSKDLPLTSDSFKGLGRISKEPYKNMFRYLYGSTNSFKTAQMLKSNADLKGYPSSYIVAYRNGERIPLKQALEYVSE